jgi:hypothetical protein
MKSPPFGSVIKPLVPHHWIAGQGVQYWAECAKTMRQDNAQRKLRQENAKTIMLQYNVIGAWDAGRKSRLLGCNWMKIFGAARKPAPFDGDPNA